MTGTGGGFPQTRLAGGKNSELEFETTRRGFRLATSVGGTLTGRGGGIVIIDDSLKLADAYSETQREKVNLWFDQTVLSRLDDKQTGTKIIVQQRLNARDLVGHLLDKTGTRWVHLCLPAIADRPQRIQFGPNLFHDRAEGDVLHPAREPRAKLDELRAEMGTPAFASQYLQAPLPPNGNIVDPRWFVSYESLQLPDHFDQIIQSWDTATKVNELADYSVCTTWGLLGSRIYLRNVLRKRLAYPDLKRAVREQSEAFGATVILIEDRSSGTQLIQELQQEGLYAVRAYAPEGDKVMRLNAQTATIENGFVLVPKESAWLEDFLHELAIFPNGQYDDQVDSTSQALAWIKQNGREPSIITFYKMEVEKPRNPPSKQYNMQMRPPAGLQASHFGTIQGRLLSVTPDKPVLVNEKEAESMICLGWTKVR